METSWTDINILFKVYFSFSLETGKYLAIKKSLFNPELNHSEAKLNKSFLKDPYKIA